MVRLKIIQRVNPRGGPPPQTQNQVNRRTKNQEYTGGFFASDDGLDELCGSVGREHL